MKRLLIKRLCPNAVLPQRATEGSAGYDLCACLDHPVEILPGERALIPTGIAIAIEDTGVAAFLFGRSGLGVKHGLCLANAVGVVDADYRGEIKVALSNHGEETYTVQPGERIAQMVLMPVLTPELEETDGLPETVRGASGFGSTGR